MKKIKLLTIIAAVFSVLAVSSCKKTPVADKSVELSMKVTDVKAINAKIEISADGEAALIRYLAPVQESVVLESVPNLDDSEAMKTYIARNGEAIKVPYNALLKDLQPETVYVVGTVAYDDKMTAVGYKMATFTTLDMASMFEDSLGDPSDAGSLTENIIK